MHTFHDWIYVKYLLERLQTKFQNDFILPSLTSQAAILGLSNEPKSIYNLLNHILQVFKYFGYMSREKHILNIDMPHVPHSHQIANLFLFFYFFRLFDLFFRNICFLPISAELIHIFLNQLVQSCSKMRKIFGDVHFTVFDWKYAFLVNLVRKFIIAYLK